MVVLADSTCQAFSTFPLAAPCRLAWKAFHPLN